MKTSFLNRFSSLALQNGRTLRNRLVVPPMASQTASEIGFVTNKTFQHYQRLSESGAGLIFVEYAFIHLTGKSEDFQLGIQSDAHMEGLERLAKQIQRSGALAGIQITHSGGKSERSLTGGFLMAPSAIAVPVKDRMLEVPAVMTPNEIDLWKSAFVDAAHRAFYAGFDVVELHAAHGYGLNQWLSPITNQRNDTYGGTLVNRMKLLLEIIAAIRDMHPELAISVRIPGQDFIAGGLTTKDSVQIAQALESAGVELIHVSSGIGGWRRPESRTGQGYLVDEAAKIQTAINRPVIGVGGIETGSYIDESLKLGKFRLAAVGRAILKDPAAWNQNHLKQNRVIKS